MRPQKMITLPLPQGPFVVSPQHTERSLLLNEEQARDLRDKLSEQLEAA